MQIIKDGKKYDENRNRQTQEQMHLHLIKMGGSWHI